MKKAVFSLFLALVCFSAFAKSPPKWTQKVHWEEGNYEYFVGTSSKSASEELGRKEAYDNAMSEAVQALFGVSGRMDLASYANLQKIQISQDIFVSTDEVKLTAESVDLYVEKMKEGGRTLYNVWRSIKVDKAAAKTELERLKQVAAAKKTVEQKVVEQEPGTVLVTVEGTSVVKNEDEPSAKADAIKNGLKKSCEKLIEDWFYKETVADNYQKLNSLVYSRCQTFVKNYEVKTGFAEENVYKASLSVYLNSGDIKRKLMDVGLFRQKF